MGYLEVDDVEEGGSYVGAQHARVDGFFDVSVCFFVSLVIL